MNHATASARPLVAKCAITGAIRLLDRSLSQQKIRPATNVTAIEPSTTSDSPATLAWMRRREYV